MLEQTAVFDCKTREVSKWGDDLSMYTGWWDRLEHGLPFGFLHCKNNVGQLDRGQKNIKTIGFFPLEGVAWEIEGRDKKKHAIREHDFSHKRCERVMGSQYQSTFRKCLVPERSLVHWKKAQRKPAVEWRRQIQQWQWSIIGTSNQRREWLFCPLIFSRLHDFLGDKL